MNKSTKIFILLTAVILSAVIVPARCFDRVIMRDTGVLTGKINDICDISSRNGKNTDIAEKCASLDLYWKNRKVKWGFYMNHSVIEKIDIEICTFESMAMSGDGNLNGQACKIMRIFDAAGEQNTLTLMNIL